MARSTTSPTPSVYLRVIPLLVAGCAHARVPPGMQAPTLAYATRSTPVPLSDLSADQLVKVVNRPAQLERGWIVRTPRPALNEFVPRGKGI
ncbi:hypothetical protein BGY98DRAFT_1184283 [Russula aff. rugulosa BPL654]|nr:hypothetical protein BGY98DRAFT_1184283 [Russula aff. rugulosa BPL654]